MPLPLPTTIFPLGPLILSKGIYLLRVLSTYYHPSPSSQVKILSRRRKTKREMKLFIPQSKIYSGTISASTAHGYQGPHGHGQCFGHVSSQGCQPQAPHTATLLPEKKHDFPRLLRTQQARDTRSMSTTPGRQLPEFLQQVLS